MNLLDLVILAIVVIAGVAGFRVLGGASRAGRLLGSVIGAGFGLTLGAAFADHGGDHTTRVLLFLAGMLVAVLIGGAVGGWLGSLLTRVLLRVRMPVLDRAAGAVAGAGSALLLLWVLATAVPALVGPGALAPITSALQPLGGHSTVLRSVTTALPATNKDLHAVLDVTDLGVPPVGTIFLR